MATQTETYKLNKPARTDKIGIDLLNENMDIIEEELKKRPLSSDVAGAAFFDLDITAWTAVDFAKENGEAFYLTEYLDGGNILAQIAAGRVPRVKFKGIDNTPHVVILSAIHRHTVTDGERTTCSGTQSNIYYDAYSNYSLNIIDNEGEYTIWFAAYPFLTGEGTVKSVNGVMPDDDGNVTISVAAEEPGTTKLDFSNWSNGSFTEHFDDGTSEAHPVVRDGTGAITSIGGITIVGVG